MTGPPVGFESITIFDDLQHVLAYLRIIEDYLHPDNAPGVEKPGLLDEARQISSRLLGAKFLPSDATDSQEPGLQKKPRKRSNA